MFAAAKTTRKAVGTGAIRQIKYDFQISILHR